MVVVLYLPLTVRRMIATMAIGGSRISVMGVSQSKPNLHQVNVPITSPDVDFCIKIQVNVCVQFIYLIYYNNLEITDRVSLCSLAFTACT